MNYFWKYKESVGRETVEKEAWFRDNLFHLQIFETFVNLGIDFNINLNKQILVSLKTTFEIILLFR